MRVFVLNIQHRYGNNVSVHRTEEGAMKCLDEHVQQEWEREMAGSNVDRPGDRREATEAYFRHMGEACGGDEFYDVTESEVWA